MTTHTAPARTLPFELGEACSHRALTVLPLFPAADSRLEYLGLDEALARGLAVTEASEAGEVNTLLLGNPLDERVLLYEGEELVGAKQNRIVGRPVFVEAHSTARILVTCVERGRWRYRSRAFASASRVGYPQLRRLQAEHRDRGSQQMVWAEVAATSARNGMASPTEAAEELYHAHAPTLEEYAHALPRLPGQSSCLVAIAGTIDSLDVVRRSDVLAGLHPKLLRGYALEELD